MNLPLWSGMAVVDREGRIVVWRGSETPKLYRGEEQGGTARTDGCALEPVVVVRGTMAEFLRSAPAVFTPAEDAPRRRYQKRRCKRVACRREFVPTGPRSAYCCTQCRAKERKVA